MLTYGQEDMCKSHGRLIQTECPTIKCSPLPPHWRYNKALPWTFKVVCLDEEVADGTHVIITAGNEGNCGQMVLNGLAKTRNGVAEFNDLRFIGRSGRGRTFKLVISVLSKPCQVATINNAIKVTVDGPRERRAKNKPFADRVSTSTGYYNPCTGNPVWFNPSFNPYPSPIPPTRSYPTSYQQPGMYPPVISPSSIYPSVPRLHPASIAPQIIVRTETSQPAFPINLNLSYPSNVVNNNTRYPQSQPQYSPSQSLPRSASSASFLTESSIEKDEESIEIEDIDIVGVEEEIVPVKCDLKAPPAKSTNSDVWRPY
ncbi:segmentation protein Runt-like [Coccinella septempunctata]|uniref:segmentation protein Runt-like n=1 Tax=Coccinella septempunctata TaxID=41139 RepID=UPI001D073D78|nr:segmentation protein Runt-like [Coccinella septempunctata]